MSPIAAPTIRNPGGLRSPRPTAAPSSRAPSGPSDGAPPPLPARRLTQLTAALVVLLTTWALATPTRYRDNAMVTDGWWGNDIVILVVAPAVLLIAQWRAGRSVTAWLVWLGALLTVGYNYAFYLFGAALNVWFLGYVAVASACLWAFAIGLHALDVPAIARRVRWGAGTRAAAGWLGLLALVLGGVHVAMTAAFMAGGTLPAIVTATGGVTNVVVALDLPLVVVPAAVAAVLLWRRHAWGLVLGMLVCVKGVLYMPALAAATFTAAARGSVASDAQAWLWLGIGAGCAAAASGLVRALREPTRD